jgi:8-hydroxy-5-deazaflavin:NADPH oxidoreductase
MKKIGIIGSGMVGQTLAEGFLKHGYQVMIGTRDKSKLTEWKSKVKGDLSIGSFAEAAAFGNTIVLAVKGNVAKDALKLAGAENLKGKTIIDATNPIADAAPENGVLLFFSDINKSLMEELQSAVPQAHFVKAFNSIGSAFMVNPAFESKPTMFICGNNEQAKKEVSEILRLFGFEAEDMGMVEAARAIEPLCILWCIPGFRENRWTHAFKLLKK